MTSRPSPPLPAPDDGGVQTVASSTKQPRWVSAFDTRPWLLAVLMGALASAVAFAGSWRVSMWTDEAATISASTRSWADLWTMLHTVDAVHGLYYATMHPWLAVFGASAVSLRLPSALAVGLSCGGVVVLTRRLAGDRASLWAGLGFAILPRMTSVGIEGRSYAATTTLAVWLTVLFVAILRRPTALRLVAYAVVGTVAGWLNIFLLLLLVSHGLTVLIDQRLKVRRSFWAWLISATVAVAATVPVLHASTLQKGQIGVSRLGPLGDVRSAVVNQWFLGETPTIFRAAASATSALALWKPASVLLAGVCWLIIGWAVLPHSAAVVAAEDSTPAGPTSRHPDFRAVLVPWIVFPTVALLGYATVGSPIYNPRYLSFAAPAVAVLIGVGLVRLRWGWPRWVAAALILVLAVPVYASQRTPYAKGGADWMQVSQFVAGHRGPGDAVYFAPRQPPAGNVIRLTSRTAAILYPAAYAGMVDLTLVSTPAQSGDLLGVSRMLTASADDLDGITSVFVVRRRDYPAASVESDTAVLTRAGFRPGPSWQGPIDNVTMFSR